MPNYELLNQVENKPENISLHRQYLPELVHLDDPGLAVMRDFNQNRPNTVQPSVSMDEALNEMKVTGCHLLMVVDDEHKLLGLLSSEDLLGEKPIQLLTEKRIDRHLITTKMLMTPIKEVAIFDLDTIEHARVGNVVNTMKELHAHYALVIESRPNSDDPAIRGLLNTSQISKQLHSEVASKIAKAQSVSELQGRL
ncbi:MAG: CBS domain-containing protein [Coxiellaceae bacterium]|nr:CBS domain-containing protein [Coxiellaceae bacterium]